MSDLSTLIDNTESLLFNTVKSDQRNIRQLTYTSHDMQFRST